jgi:hypothetical protein
MNARNLLLCIAWMGLGAGGRSGAQIAVRQPVSDAPAETYSLRVENAQYGRVEISLDKGVHTILIGRVLKPALQMLTEKTANAPGSVLRAQSDGIAFCVASGRVMKLLPAPLIVTSAKTGKRTTPAPGAGAMVTDMARGKGLFGELLPPVGTGVGAIADTPREAPFPADYTPALDDVFVFHVRLPLPAATEGQTDMQREEALRERVRVQVTALQKEYAAGAVARARGAGRKVVSGTLTLRANVPEGEPDPITAVTYIVDGRFIAAQDTAPFVYPWNTRNVEDGEHVLEIRAVNRDARPVTRIRALVVVQNRPATPPTSGASTPPSPPSSP